MIASCAQPWELHPEPRDKVRVHVVGPLDQEWGPVKKVVKSAAAIFTIMYSSIIFDLPPPPQLPFVPSPAIGGRNRSNTWYLPRPSIRPPARACPFIHFFMLPLFVRSLGQSFLRSNFDTRLQKASDKLTPQHVARQLVYDRCATRPTADTPLNDISGRKLKPNPLQYLSYTNKINLRCPKFFLFKEIKQG